MNYIMRAKQRKRGLAFCCNNRDCCNVDKPYKDVLVTVYPHLKRINIACHKCGRVIRGFDLAS